MRQTFSQVFRAPMKELIGVLSDHSSSAEKERDAASILILEASVWFLKRIWPEDKEIEVRKLHHLFASPIMPSFPKLEVETKEQLDRFREMTGARWKSSTKFASIVRKYKDLEGFEKAVEIKFNGNIETIIWMGTTTSERSRLFEEYFQELLKHQERPSKFAKEGVYEFQDGEEWKTLSLSKPFLQSTSNNRKRISPGSQRPLWLPKDKLLEAADEIDAILQKKNERSVDMRQRIERIVMESFDEHHEQMEKKEGVYVNGMENVAGPLSVGKSTLMQVVAYQLSKEHSKKRTTLVVKDVTEALKLVDFFGRLGVDAVPMLSGNNRNNHVSQYLSSLTEQDQSTLLFDVYKRKAFRYLSTSCPVRDSQHEPSDKHFSPPPCQSLVQKGEDRKKAERKWCPYFQQCDYHNAFHDLEGADVVVSTIESLVYMKLPQPLFQQEMSLLEYVTSTSDLVMVDEADRVQQRLDQIFIPNTKIRGKKNHWLNSIHQAVMERIQSQPRLTKYENINSWRNHLSVATHCVDNMIHRMESIERRERLKGLVGKQTFNSYTLLRVISAKIAGVKKWEDASEDKAHLAGEVFRAMERASSHYKQDLDLDSDFDLAFWEAVETQDETMRKRKIERFMKVLEEEVSLSFDSTPPLEWLDFAFYTLNVEKRLALLTRHYGDIRQEMRIQELEDSALFSDRLREYEGVVPLPPIGFQFGFRYHEDTNLNGEGSLQLLRYIGVGRYLLTHLDRLFTSYDQSGTNVMLLSGTNFAEGSSRYHIDLPVSHLLSLKEEEPSKVTYRFMPLEKVSGRYGNEREQALERSVSTLVRRGFFPRLFEELDANRKRIVLIVGSYVEAKKVASELRKSTMFEDGEVAALSNRTEESSASEEYFFERQKLDQLKSSRIKVLVAPLLSMERGHNILNHEAVAAFGAAIYLVRPYPVPDDITALAYRVNAASLNAYQDKDLAASTLGAEFGSIRTTAYARMTKYLSNQYGYIALDDRERKEVLMETNTVCHQFEGRLIRGNVSAIVIYADASFSPREAMGERDTWKTSMLVGWKKELNRLKKSNPDIMDVLYRSRIEGLNQLEVMSIDEYIQNAKTKLYTT
ncbi:hypothetical protein IMZ31_17170 [Pontibacillus sp. ALD_SL1]|uniref:hypothetical protein n=1 Tax=Pontibacillus sp. ALD_SL1 TaxID=2777185 RepID=UPI001A970A1A|nr:hypothetical protein [Pontibacillus sp. ALD_SL1]QSS99772.1 hypothetical protein IMZ31_17170 [Pontibacillus sp. ALD_SL1]